MTTSVALTPAAPGPQFASLDRPFGLWIGSEDELFVPDAVLSYADRAESVREQSEAAVIPGARHLSVLIGAHETMGPWLSRTAQGLSQLS